MPFAGGLDRDQRHLIGGQPALELSLALAGIGNTERFTRGQDVDIKPAFADVDPHVSFALGLLFGHFLALHAGLSSDS
jgi:hypothetical protein